MVTRLRPCGLQKISLDLLFYVFRRPYLSFCHASLGARVRFSALFAVRVRAPTLLTDFRRRAAEFGLGTRRRRRRSRFRTRRRTRSERSINAPGEERLGHRGAGSYYDEDAGGRDGRRASTAVPAARNDRLGPWCVETDG